MASPKLNGCDMTHRGSKSSAETSPKASVAAGSRLSSGSEPYSIEGQPPQPGAPEGSRTGLSPAAGGPRHSTGTESGIGSGATRSSGVGAGVGAGAAGVGSGAAAASAALASRGSTGDIDSDKDRSHTSPVVGAGNLSREGGDGLASAIGSECCKQHLFFVKAHEGTDHRHGHGTRHASDINPDEE